MSKIVIADLPDSVELDDQAMRTVLGGSRNPRERLAQQLEARLKKPQELKLMDLARGKFLSRR